MFTDTDTNPRLLELQKVGDPAIGFISIVEPPVAPFIPRRVYWTYGTPADVVRGNHAHKFLQQILVAVSGRVYVTTENMQGVKHKFILDNASTGLYVPAACWRTLHFEDKAILITLASDVFEEDDYIRNYDDFTNWIISHKT